VTEPTTTIFDPRDEATMQCPFGPYARLRTEDPVHRIPAAWIGRAGEYVYAVSRFDLVSQVLADWTTFSSQFGTSRSAPPAHLVDELRAIAAEGYVRPPTMLHADPPAHTRYRRLVSKAFTPKRVAELGPTIERICAELCDAMDAGPQPVDLVAAYAVPIPTRATATALGVPDERYLDFKRWADAEVAAIGRQLSDEAWLRSAREVVELQQYFAAELEARRREPRDDLLTDLLQARLTPDDEVEGEPLSMEEMISIVQQLQVAGSETTASLISDMVVVLAHEPARWVQLPAEPERTSAVVEDMLRLLSPNQGSFRIAAVDTELAGVPIPKGATIWVMFGAANRDEAHYERPDVLDPERPGLFQHLAFGRGPHYCLGAPLARLEAIIALRTLTQRYARIEVVDEASLRYQPSWILRGLTRLDVRLVPRSRPAAA
jgi:cytochrome P450